MTEEIYNRQEDLNLNTDQKILVIGAGGIGYWVVKYLVMSGVKDIVVFDHDVIEVSNLNRLDIPLGFVGKNKASVISKIAEHLREDINVKAYPFSFDTIHMSLIGTKPSIMVDCTDNIEIQTKNEKIANSHNMEYMKLGYDGIHLTITNNIPEWGESLGGYIKVPSWVVPASIVAALGVARILKIECKNKELSCDVTDFFVSK